MTMKTFINNNRIELIDIIHQAVGSVSVGDDEIEDFIINTESLYNWALSNGVDC